MKTQHTPGRLTIEDNGLELHLGGQRLPGGLTTLLATINGTSGPYNDQRPSEEAHANAARLVRGWNLLHDLEAKGINPEAMSELLEELKSLRGALDTIAYSDGHKVGYLKGIAKVALVKTWSDQQPKATEGGR